MSDGAIAFEVSDLKPPVDNPAATRRREVVSQLEDRAVAGGRTIPRCGLGEGHHRPHQLGIGQDRGLEALDLSRPRGGIETSNAIASADMTPPQATFAYIPALVHHFDLPATGSEEPEESRIRDRSKSGRIP